MVRVFISYSWDSQEHIEWVVSFGNTLRKTYGIEARLDNFLQISNLNKMMVQEISSNDKIIIIVTSNYTLKANSFSGGVGSETELLLNYINSNPNKIIVLLKEKCEKPFYLKGYYHIDFTDDCDKAMNELVLKINDAPIYEIEPVNTKNPKRVNSKKSKLLIPDEVEENNVAKIEKILSITNSSFNDQGKIKCEQWIKEFGYEIVEESAKISISQYLVKNQNGKYTKDSINKVFNKIGGICHNKYEEKMKPYITGTKKVINYCRKKFRYISISNENLLEAEIGMLLYEFFKIGIYEEKIDDIMQKARISASIYDFINALDYIKSEYRF